MEEVGDIVEGEAGEAIDVRDLARAVHRGGEAVMIDSAFFFCYRLSYCLVFSVGLELYKIALLILHAGGAVRGGRSDPLTPSRSLEGKELTDICQAPCTFSSGR